MRALYTVLLTLLTPLIVLRLMLKSLALPAYRARMAERFGYVRRPPEGIAVWLHAVSVGESLAALPLINALIAEHGERRVWVTTTTPTGSERIQAALGERVCHSYAPYDLPWIVARFLARVQPQQVVVMETELWPNLFAALKARGTPLMIANARLSPRSFKGYGRVASFCRSVLSAVHTVAAQSPLDAERFAALGAPRVEATGNLKFDLALPAQPAALTAQLQALSTGPIWAAVSTHEGEEQAALAAHQQLLQTHPQALLLLVPRHPQRFDAVAAQISASGLAFCRRSALKPIPDSPLPIPVVLIDSMGEVLAVLAASQIAFVGGSLVPVGGHNVLEPAALGVPVLFGPHMHNFLAARDLLLQAEVAQQIAGADALAAALRAWLPPQAEPEQIAARSARAAAAIAANRGALARHLTILRQHRAAA